MVLVRIDSMRLFLPIAVDNSLVEVQKEAVECIEALQKSAMSHGHIDLMCMFVLIVLHHIVMEVPKEAEEVIERIFLAMTASHGLATPHTLKRLFQKRLIRKRFRLNRQGDVLQMKDE